MKVRIKKWDEYQHYKDRNPPWVKLHVDMLTSEAWAMSSDKDRLTMLTALMVASRGKNHGEIPSEEYMKRIAYMAQKPSFQGLVDVGFFEKLEDDSKALADASGAQANDSASVSVSDTSSFKSKKPYGEFGRVRLTDDEYAKLVDKHGATKVEKGIGILDAYIESKGKRYNSHYAVMHCNSWVWERVGELGGGAKRSSLVNHFQAEQPDSELLKEFGQ